MKLAKIAKVVNYYENVRVRVAGVYAGEYSCAFYGKCGELRKTKPKFLKKTVLSVCTFENEEGMRIVDIFVE